MANWTLDQLKQELSKRPTVKGWVLSREHVQRRERYFLADRQTLAIDQDRNVRAHALSARIFVKLSREGRQGEITQKFFPSLPLGPQLDAAVEGAAQTDHLAWDLPVSPPSNLPTRKTADPRIAEDVERAVRQASEKIGLLVAVKRATQFSSAELFISLHDRELHLSNGLIHRSSQSRVYSEAAFSMSRKNARGQIESDEYLNTTWAVGLDDLKLDALFNEASDRAEHSLDIKKPQSGRYPVVVEADVLAMLFNTHLSHLTALNAYHRLPFTKPGDEFIPGAEGDLITLSLDPTLDFAADTLAVSEQGLEQKPLLLVDKNRVVATSADLQYGSYQKTSPTTSRGNVVVAPGTLSYGELLRSEPLVLEVLQFSALFPDAASGTFSSEIRLARLHDQVTGTVTYIKGGSLSGSIAENFKSARFSKETAKKAHFDSGNSGPGQGYFGPAYALLSDVSVVG